MPVHLQSRACENRIAQLNRRSFAVGSVCFVTSPFLAGGIKTARAQEELAIPILGLLPGLPAIVTLSIAVARTIGSLLLDDTLSELSERISRITDQTRLIYATLSNMGVKIEEVVQGQHFERTSKQAQAELFDFAIVATNPNSFLDSSRVNQRITRIEKIINRLEQHGPQTLADICCLFSVQIVLRKIIGAPDEVIAGENRRYSNIIAKWIDDIGDDSLRHQSQIASEFSRFGGRILERSFFDLPVACAQDILDGRLRSIEFDLHVEMDHGSGSYTVSLDENIELSTERTLADFGGQSRLIFGGPKSAGGLFDHDFELSEVTLPREVALARARQFALEKRTFISKQIDRYLSDPEKFDQASVRYSELLLTAQDVVDALRR